MKRTTMAIVLLCLLLVGSNLFWAYTVVDEAVNSMYLQTSCEKARGTARQALAVLTEVARGDATRQSVIAAAVRVQPDSDPFEKEGFIWVGDIGLRFDGDDRFIEATPAVEPL